ncbi:hypothetical protein B7R21_18585 [Subtercola boreus]|uniref:Uncharacterized protein n=1 Tax=Subtercola boreus TaxID=120213 RepID=A0A3E0VAA9_9MICO|nr:hypothetical protein [Subtercola boreus]RFA06782.1 hypothetical protein B7R21_18585 [Subtercola boreus]
MNGENIAVPAAYESADVQEADVIESGGQGSVHVTFTDEGGKVLNSVTTQAAQAADGARLVMKAGDAIIGAPVALTALESSEVSIAVPQGNNAQDLRDAILGH